MPHIVYLRCGPETAKYNYPEEWEEIKGCADRVDYGVIRGSIANNIKHHIDNGCGDITLAFRVPSSPHIPEEESDLIVTVWERDVERDAYFTKAAPLSALHQVAEYHGVY